MNVFVLVYALKIFRALFLWLAWYVAEKVSLDAFVTSVYVERKGPPKLQSVVAWIFLADFLFGLFMLAVAYFAMARSSGGEPIVGGWRVLLTAAADLYICWQLGFFCSLAVVIVAQKQTCCRYKDDGLRGIRASFVLAFLLSLTVSAPPYFLIF